MIRWRTKSILPRTQLVIGCVPLTPAIEVRHGPMRRSERAAEADLRRLRKSEPWGDHTVQRIELDQTHK